MHAAVSLTANGSTLRLVERIQSPAKGGAGGGAVAQVRPAVAVPYGWDGSQQKCSPHLQVLQDGVSVQNKGSSDSWQVCQERIHFL